MGIKKITCIQLDGEFPDLGHRFVMPDYGLPLIGTILSEAGYEVKVYVEHIKPLNGVGFRSQISFVFRLSLPQ